MYESFFGLADTPFRLTPDPRYLFLSRKHAEALAHLKLGLRESSGFVCITGDVGTGKTTLLRSFLGGLGPEVATAYIFNPPLSALELLRTISGELGLSAVMGSRKRLVDALNAHLLAQREAGRRSIVVIDEAQALPIDVLEQLRLLSNLETTTEKLLRIVLVGQPQLRALLLHPELVQLNQRITLRWHMGPLSYRETVAYVAHRLAVASGGAAPPVFTRAAVRRIHGISGGVPRLINMVAHRAMLAAFAAEQRLVNARVVRQAYREIGALPLAASAPRASRRLGWAAIAVAACLGVIAFGVGRLGWRPELRLRSMVESLVPEQARVAERGPIEPAGGAPEPTLDPLPSEGPAGDTPAVEPHAPAADEAPAPPSEGPASAQVEPRAVEPPAADVGAAGEAAPPTADAPAVADAPPVAPDVPAPPVAPDVPATADAPPPAANVPAVAEAPSPEFDVPTTAQAPPPATDVLAAADVPPRNVPAGGEAPPRAPADVPATAQPPPPETGAPVTAPRPATEPPPQVAVGTAPVAPPAPVGPAAAPVAPPVAPAAAPVAPPTAPTPADSPAPEEKSAPADPARRLAALDTLTTARGAMAAVLAAWHVSPLSEDEQPAPATFGAVAQRRGLDHLPLVGNGSMLRLLDLPAILELRIPGSEGPRFVALVGMTERQATLVIEGSPAVVDGTFLDHHWFGEAHILWRDFESLGATVGREGRGVTVARLQSLLRGLGAYRGSVTGVFDDATESAVIDFQRSRFLVADGRVGRLTRIVLYAAAGGYPRPTLGASS